MWNLIGRKDKKMFEENRMFEDNVRFKIAFTQIENTRNENDTNL